MQNTVLTTYTLATTATIVDIQVAFNENSKGKAFFGDSWQSFLSVDSYDLDNDGNWIVKKGYTVASSDKSFPTALYRSDKCFKGYAFDKTATVGYTELDDDIVTEYMNFNKTAATPYSATNPMVLYAIWGDCSANTAVRTITLENSDKGVYKFVRKFDLGLNAAGTAHDSTSARVYEYADANMTFTQANDGISFTGISFTVNDGENVILDTETKMQLKADADSAVWRDYDDGLLNVNEEIYYVRRVGYVKAPILKNSYRFAYDKNYTDAKAVFYSPDFVASEIYTIADVTQSKNLLSLDVMARADACVSGWSLTADGAKVIGAFDAVALRKLDTLAAAGKATDKLYAVWADKSSAECSELKTFTVTSAMDASLGSFKVYRVLGEDTTWYDVGANGVEIPTLAGMKLGVKFTAATSTYTFGN
ncbi:MAG: hypothetical protein IKH04_08860, partial [Kiritimatiellae bacterium]|nr:hypothetical protein [Kiritimatiellia bacterium]